MRVIEISAFQVELDGPGAAFAADKVGERRKELADLLLKTVVDFAAATAARAKAMSRRTAA